MRTRGADEYDLSAGAYFGGGGGNERSDSTRLDNPVMEEG